MNATELLNEMKALSYWAKQAGQYNLAQCSSGNISHRLDDGTLLISQTRAWLSNLESNQVARVNLTDGSITNNIQPSGELPMHLAVMRKRPDAKTVLHCQSVSATTLACCERKEIDYNVIIEVPVYIGKVRHIPYYMPGSAELANAVAEASESADIIQLRNHGQVIIGFDYAEVIQKAVFFELACTIILNNSFNYASIKGENLKILSGYRK